MALDPFPTIARVTGFSRTPIKPANRQKSAAGYTMSAGRGTVLKRGFKLSIAATSTEMYAVEAFFDSHQGGSFSITSQDPADTTEYEVTFNQDSIPFRWDSGKNRWMADIEFMEV